MRRKWKKLLSTTLALAMVITTIGVREVPVSAAEEENTNESVVYMDNMAYDTTTGHFYKLSSVGTYEQVNAEAKESGGYLACISSAEENEIVAKVSSTGKTTTSSYIGLMRNEENIQEWMWADGSEVNYTNWNEGEPNSENEKVAEIYDSTRSPGAEKWNDCTVSSRNTGVIEYNECIHPESQYVVKNKTFADCEQGGYTGDTYCGFCNEKIADGKETEPGGHAEAVIDEKTVKEATCTEEGYTGDKICPTCKKVLEHGKTTPVNGHTESEELRKVREASCYLDGYTGETYCIVCGETLEAGDAITKLEHEYEDNVCKNCGRINNAQLDTTYTSKTTNLYPFQVIQFKAPENGKYKFHCENITVWDSYGYLFKEENFNDQVIKGGIEKFNAKLENSNVENSRLNSFWGVNDDGGKNGAPAMTEELEKDKTYYFVLGTYYAYTYTGEFSVTITCTHDKTHIEGKTLSDCTVGGYTGDTVCDTCGKVVEQGQTLEPGEHQEAVLDVKDATCYVTGYTGDTYCSVCNIKLAEGTVTPKLEHEYEDNVCKNCGRINNAQLDTTYTSKTTNSYPFQVIQFKAPENGKYKFYCENIKNWDSYGYLFKKENFNDQIIIDGIEKFNAKKADSGAEIPTLSGYWQCDDEHGKNSAPAITAELEKDKTYYFVVGPYSTATGEFRITITCAHEKTHIEGRTFSNCIVGGYTGDIVCDTCGKVVEQGQTLEPGEHQEAVLDVKDATCYVTGYTGDTYCSVCNIKLAEGTVTPKLEHEYEDNVCKNCGRINNAQLDTTYTSKTTNLYPFQVIQFKAPENGKYKFHCENITVWDSYGYLFKEENFNDQVIIDGIEKFNAKIENNAGDDPRLKGYWDTNDDDGVGSAPEITAELEKDKIYYFVVGPYSTATGEFSITITCTHEKTHKEGRTLSDCTEGGYTGDVICDTCGKLVEQGQTLEPGEHTVEVVDAREANCYIEGKTGEEKCSVCDKVLKENEVIPKLEHKYENEVCVNCGRIENAKKGTEYSSYITEKLPIQVVEYTAPETEKIIFECNNTRYWNSIGYLFDETNYSDEMLMDELEKYYSGDSDYISFKNYLAENEYGGGTGAPAIKYKVQKDKKYYLVIVSQENDYGEFTVTIDCPHDRTHVENKAIKTCSEGGYTGDVICDLCGKVVKHGENIEPDSEHNYINYKSIEPTCNEYGKRYLKCVNCGNKKVLEDEDYGYADHRYVLVNSVKATCTTDGYLGDSKCKYCGLENENQPENKVIKAYHDMDPEEIDSCLINDYKSVEATCEKEGYTGDVYCTICHKVIEEGKTIEKLEHSFKDGKCMECGADEEVVKSEKDGYYEISTFDQLITYLKNVESGISGKLINDIEFPENYDDEDDVIGRKTLKNSTFDGNGHKISGINSNGTQTKLFDDIYVSEIKDLEIECKEKEDGRGLGVYLADSTIDSKFTNCSITGNRIEIDGYCSAMIRKAYASEFIHCINNADIIYNNDTQIVAGLVCEAENCIFDKCENNGNIATTKAYVVGGIIAQAKNCIIKDCINRGDITTYGYTAGIVAGVTNADNRPCTTSITGCTNEGKVESIAKGNHTYTAGICIIYNGSNGSTYADELIINNCVNNGEIEGDTVAGIIGNSSGNLKLSDCENNGAINGRYSAGGIAQCIENKNSNEAEVSNCINNGNVFGGAEAAGIIDYAEGITVTNCINNGNISSNGYVGGIFSYTSSVKGTGLVNNGKISGLEDIGGISAYDEGNSIFSKLYNTGVIDEENIGAQVSNLVKLGESSTGEELEEEHKHDYVALSTVTKATTEKDGYIEKRCKCGQTEKQPIKQIKSVDISNTKFEYTGNSITPTVTVNDTDDKVISSEYYTVTYRNKATGKAVDEVKEVGTYEVVVTFKDLYEGQVVKQIVVENTNKPSNPKTDNPNAGGKVSAKVTKPAKVKGVSAKNNKKKSLTVKWRKVNGVKGYQLRYATNKKMKKAKIITITKNKLVIKKLAKKKYYIQVCAYKVDSNGKKVKGKWSAKKAIKVKK
ncbi:lectin-like protein [Eubacterium ventriosum]|uniref:lectin-like protein n=1 Tax=Eubacterium ventriosum TaxID=39496 RepID=UPI0039936848